MGRLASYAARPGRLVAAFGGCVAVASTIRGNAAPRADTPLVVWVVGTLVFFAIPLSAPWIVLAWTASIGRDRPVLALAECALGSLIAAAQIAFFFMIPTAVPESGGFVLVWVLALSVAAVIVIVMLWGLTSSAWRNDRR